MVFFQIFISYHRGSVLFPFILKRFSVCYIRICYEFWWFSYFYSNVAPALKTWIQKSCTFPVLRVLPNMTALAPKCVLTLGWNLYDLLQKIIMNRYAHLINLILFRNWTICCFCVGSTCIHRWEGARWKGGGGCRLEGEAPEGLHSIRKTLNGFLQGNCWGRTEEIDGYMSHILLLAEQ